MELEFFFTHYLSFIKDFREREKLEREAVMSDDEMENPLEEGNQRAIPTGTQPQHRPSFKDKLTGGVSIHPGEKYVDLIDNGQMKVSYLNDNPLLPKIVTEKEVLEDMCAPWRDALVV